MQLSTREKLLLILFLTFSEVGFSQYFLLPHQNDTKTILPHLVGFNNQMASKNEPWLNSEYTRALQNSEIGLLRYPGGTVSNYWDMEKNRLFRNVTDIDTFENNPRSFIKTENVIDWVVPMWQAPNSISNLKLAHNAMSSSNPFEPAVVFVLNMITPGADYYSLKWNRKVNETPLSEDWWLMMNDRLKRNIKMLDEVIANEMEVKYVEFGNEYFFGQSRAGDGTNGGAIVEPYSAGAANTSLAGAFPGNGKTYADAVNQWADTLIKRYPGIRLSAIAADANSTSPSRRNSWNTEVVQFIDKDLVPAVSVHLYGGVEDGNLITTEENLGKAFISWKTHWEWKKKYSSFPAAREFWLTEYNSNQDKKTWGHGLLNLFIIHTLLSEVQLGLTNYHQFAQNTTDGSEIYASTRVLAMLARATRGKNSARQIKLNKELYLEGTDNKLPSVIAWSFSEKGNDESSYFLANFSAKEIELDITNIADSDGKFYYYSSSSLNNQNDQGIKFASINKNINLKPYSCYWFDAGGFLSVSSRKVEKQNQSDLKIFPNPGSDRISLIIDNKLSGANINLEIYAGSGVLKDEFHGNIKEIETEINKKINDWKPGLYILSFRTKDFTRTIKWVKK